MSKQVDFTLDEPNVLVLDMAQFKLSGDDTFSDSEEVLRLDNICRKRLNLPLRKKAVAQPWSIEEVRSVDELTLRFSLESEIEYLSPILTLEELKKIKKITFNGETVEKKSIGKYVDIAIDKLKLSPIHIGTNILEVVYEYGEKTDIENMFILGDFSVGFVASKPILTKLPEKIGFADLTMQGFPFYSDKFTYNFDADSLNGELLLRCSHYRGALIEVTVDGVYKGDIIYPPYTLKATGLSDGKHSVGLSLFIHRYNTFGPLYLAETSRKWHGPDAWRSEGASWAYEYILRKVGILTTPTVYTEQR